MRVCGFPDNVRDRFIAVHRIGAIGDFEYISTYNAKLVVKMYNERQRQQDHKLGFLEQVKFQACLWWYHYLVCC